MLDCSRNAVMRPEAVKRMIDILSKMGYGFVMLYTEDTYEVKGQPFFGHMRGKYSIEELRDMDSYAAEKGMTLMPCIQTLAHLNAIMQWDKYRELLDCHDILCAGEDKVYELIDDMFASLAEAFTCRTVNIGMDEAQFIGLGNYMQKHGIQDRLEILINHLKRVSDIAKKYGFSLLMWGDMFFRIANGGEYYNGEVDSSVADYLPDNVTLIYWDYYSTEKEHYDRNILAHQRVKKDIWFAGGIWTWSGFAPHCSYGMQISKAAVTSCLEHGINNIIMTMWGDDGAECARFSSLPALYAVSRYAVGEFDEAAIKQGFLDMFGISFDDFMLLELTGTPNTLVRNYPCTPEKYLLYNDCFMGLMDSTVSEGDGELYKKAGERLSKLVKHPEYGYLFRSQRALCELISVKAEIGVRTRNAYQAHDIEALKALVPDYEEIISRTEAFYEAFEQQWMTENKPHGFDVMDIRLGGIATRVRHCLARLKKYINGELDRLEELEEPMLDRFCADEPQHEHVDFPNYARIATANVIAW